eukprot:TRINITY_DN69920_c0_g1_i1.p1 TRINITY_DN69920_c0_g1~~TRINITY_DN69920_c0_g1_i1.p1  ORF type:complete len:276 (+),score=52.16 TRINITY_DN69920_c0_g1_i1:45-830(+)
MAVARCRQCLQLATGETTYYTRDVRRAAASNDQQQPAFRASVDGFQLGKPVVFDMTVRHGDAVWRIRRRYKQVWTLHTNLQQALQYSTLLSRLPPPPPRVTFRSAIFGERDTAFLEKRSLEIEAYIGALLEVFPCVEMVEALHQFLCYTTLRSWRYGSVIGGGAPPVDARAVATLPRALNDIHEADEDQGEFPTKSTLICVVCQDKMNPQSVEDDVRTLPCGHEFHFRCISQWLKQRNTCCICNGSAIPTAPRLMQCGDLL